MHFDTESAGQIPGAEPWADRLAALAHPARLTILQKLAAGRCCCCKDVLVGLDLAQSTVSEHLKILLEAGLIRRVGEGRRSGYFVDPNGLRETADWLNDLAGCCCAPAAEPTLTSERHANG